MPLFVDLVDHRGERRRLAGPRRTGDEHQTARALRQRGQHLRQTELLERLDLLGNDAVDGADGAPLVEHVGAEPRHALDAEREVELERLLEPLLLRVGEHAVGELLRVGGCQIRAFQPLEMAMDADLRRRIDRQVEVGPSLLDEHLQQFWERGHYFTVSLTTSSTVVTPSLTFLSPLWRSEIIPSSTALRRSSRDDAPTRISSRSSSVTSMTS